LSVFPVLSRALRLETLFSHFSVWVVTLPFFSFGQYLLPLVPLAYSRNVSQLGRAVSLGCPSRWFGPLSTTIAFLNGLPVLPLPSPPLFQFGAGVDTLVISWIGCKPCLFLSAACSFWSTPGFVPFFLPPLIFLCVWRRSKSVRRQVPFFCRGHQLLISRTFFFFPISTATLPKIGLSWFPSMPGSLWL